MRHRRLRRGEADDPEYGRASGKADVARLQPVEMVTIDDPLFGGWAQAQPKHFDDGGLYDQIFTAR